MLVSIPYSPTSVAEDVDDGAENGMIAKAAIAVSTEMRARARTGSRPTWRARTAPWRAA